MKSLILGVLLWLALAPAGLATSLAPLVLTEQTREVSLNGTPHLAWLEHDGSDLTLQQVSEPAQAAHFVAAPAVLPRSARLRPQWFRLQFQQAAAAGDWVLATQSTALQEVQFHGPFDATGRVLAPPVHTGLSLPYTSRPLGSERYLMRLQPGQAGSYTVYVRLLGGATPALGLSLWDTAHYLQWRQHKRLFDGICYGILLALLAYNLALALSLRDASYGFYVGQCACALLTLGSFNGHAAHYLWGDWPWWQERANVVLPGLWLLSGALFTRSFLNTRRLHRLDLLLQFWGVVALGAVLLGLAGQLVAAQSLNEFIASAGMLTALAAALVLLRQGAREAAWYLTGQGGLLLAALGTVLVNWKVLQAPFILANGLQLAIALEMVIFAVALSTRISHLQTSQIALRLRADLLAEAAATDPLTGLANRTGLAHGAAPLLVPGARAALLLIDLDGFKPINDTHGHDAGDAVLRAVAARLRDDARGGDVVARIGGDEFVLLLAHAPDHAALEHLAQRLHQALCEPVWFQGQGLQVGASIGIACGLDGDHRLETLLRQADQAMYHAKHTRSGHAFHPAAQDDPHGTGSGDCMHGMTGRPGLAGRRGGWPGALD